MVNMEINWIWFKYTVYKQYLLKVKYFKNIWIIHCSAAEKQFSTRNKINPCLVQMVWKGPYLLLLFTIIIIILYTNLVTSLCNTRASIG